MVGRDDIRIGKHARQAMLDDEITFEMIRYVLREGEVIEDYPEDERGHSYLTLGFWNGHPIHVCASDKDLFTFVITTYSPDAARWTDDFKRRKFT